MIPAPDVDPSADWLDAWTGYELELKSLGRSRHTIYQRERQTHILARHATAAGLGPEDVDKKWMRHYLLAQQEGREGNGYLTIYECMRQFWLWFSREYEKPCPMDGIPRPQLKEVETPVLEPDEIAALLRVCNGRSYIAMRDRAMILVLLQTGMRRAELSALNWGDLDMREGTAIIRHGKGDKARKVTFGEDAHQALWRVLRAARKLGQASDSDPVFLTSTTAMARHRRLAPEGVGWRVTELGKQAGITTMHAHVLRHSWAHYARDLGMQEGDMMVLGGWANPNMLRRYGKAKAQERAIAAGKRFTVTAGVR